MDISFISPGSFNSTISVGSDSKIAKLVKEQNDLEKEIINESKSKDDAKTKQEKLKEMQQELMLIEMEIARRQAKIKEQNAEEQQKSAKETATSPNKNREKDNPFGTIDIFA